MSGSMERAPASDLRDEDLHDFLVEFYARLGRDPLLASYFEPLDLAEHIPRIEAFWSTILFGTRRYTGNAFLPHRKLEGLTPEHFARWVEVLEATLDATFEGPCAEEMKSNAHRIAYAVQLRLGIAPFTGYRA